MALEPSGPVCFCGSRGCLTTLVSERSILLALDAAGSSHTTLYGVIDSARRGDPRAAVSCTRRAAIWAGPSPTPPSSWPLASSPSAERSARPARWSSTASCPPPKSTASKPPHPPSGSCRPRSATTRPCSAVSPWRSRRRRPA
ncbi:ROK family protein [Streptomyces sp. M19]